MGSVHSKLSLMSVGVLSFAILASAANAQQTRLRGEIEDIAGNSLTLKTHDGKIVKVLLDDKVTVNHAIQAKLDDLTLGTYVGVGSVPDGDELKAAHVQIFPPTTGAREGHGPWNADPALMMTNAPVSAVVTGQTGGMLTLTANGQSYDIKVGPDTPIVRTVAGTRDLVKKGAWVSISNAVEKDGVFAARQIVVSDDRRYPAR